MYPYHHVRIFRLSRHTVLKTGFSVRPAEPSAMRYVATHSRIPIPIVFKSWTLSNGSGAFIMEWIQGSYTFEQQRKIIGTDRSLKIVHKVRSFVEELRSLPQPDDIRGMVCAFDGSTCFDDRIQSQKCGPFASEGAFNRYRLGLLGRFLWEPSTRKQIENIKLRLRDDHRIVLTHGDLKDCNILMDNADNVVAIIDWETAGWMPEYWEYIKAVHGRWHDEEWVSLTREIAPPYGEEMEVDDQYLIVNGSPF